MMLRLKCDSSRPYVAGTEPFLLHVISRKKLKEFAIVYAEAYAPLDRWFRAAKQAKWENFAEIRAEFPSADVVGELIVFNIGGNKFRLVAEVNYEFGRVYLRHVLTHREYDKGTWKD